MGTVLHSPFRMLPLALQLYKIYSYAWELDQSYVPHCRSGCAHRFIHTRKLVYPSEGGEYTLEMLRASLPQYRPSFPNDCDTEEVDMEMTMAYPTVNVPVIPDLFGTKKSLEQRRAWNPEVKGDISFTGDQDIGLGLAGQRYGHETRQHCAPTVCRRHCPPDCM